MKTLIRSLILSFSAISISFSAEKNIILFVTDDQSPDAGCYGNKIIKMPNLDMLASDGTLFKHAFATTA
ncbi:MAG: sulfatase-like hydrolase/transferase, partial [Verrucomicrobiales bacterium]|nr:sulfatase-like hydrolase/transferase [Verrucomicrobiales bacterium]